MKLFRSTQFVVEEIDVKAFTLRYLSTLIRLWKVRLDKITLVDVKDISHD